MARTRSLSDALMKARAPAAQPSTVSYIVNGIKHTAGCAPVRVCPQDGPETREHFARETKAQAELAQDAPAEDAPTT